MPSAETPRSDGEVMHGWARELWPVCRSLTGDGVRRTLRFLQQHAPALELREVPSGTPAFDWIVPEEWNIAEAWIEDEAGRRIVDFASNNLHVVGYSVPVDRWLELDELQQHLHSLPELPQAVPYVTSYYERRWGFCLSHSVRQALVPGRYRAVIRSRLEAGSLTYADALLKGREQSEVMLSTYVCHPSMANNELSGPVVATRLLQWLSARPSRRHSYRFVFVPETIGAIAYLSRHLPELKRNVIAGFQLTCLGDERAWSFMPSRRGNTLADRTARHVLAHVAPGYERYSFLQRGSDERQYCSPGVDLPFASIVRSKYGEYPEYHTSLDDLTLVTPAGLEGSFAALKRAIDLLEANRRYRATVPCEPQLGRRGLYPTLSTRGSSNAVRTMKNVLAYADGSLDLIELAETIEEDATTLLPIVGTLLEAGLLDTVDGT